MVPAPCDSTAPVPPPAYQRALAKHSASLHLDARTIVETLHLLALCRLAVRLARPGSPAALPKGPGGAPRVYSDASLLLIALLRTLWRLSLRDMRDWLVAWPALAAACGLPADDRGRPRVPSPGTMSKRAAQAGAPPYEVLFVEAVRQALRARLIGARDLIIDSAPIKAWRRADPDARYGHAPAHHPTAFLQGFRLHTLLCRGSGLPGTRARVSFRLAPANQPGTRVRVSPFARPLLALAARLYGLRVRTVRLDAAYWGPALIAWIHTTLHATAVIPWNPKRTKPTRKRVPRLPAAHLDPRGTGQAHQHGVPSGSVLRAHHALLPPGTLWVSPAAGRLDRRDPAGRPHLHRRHRRRPGCAACRAPRPRPLPQARPRPRLGGPPRELRNALRAACILLHYLNRPLDEMPHLVTPKIEPRRGSVVPELSYGCSNSDIVHPQGFA